METEHLRWFLDVARAGSIARAARLRGIDPSQVSRAIAALEGSLGVRLLHRTTRRLSLTEVGERWFADAPAVLDALDRLRDEARTDARDLTGAVRLTASVAYADRVLTPLLPAFQAAYPRLGVDLVATDAALDLAADQIDLAIRLGPEQPGAAIRLATTRYRVVASPQHIRAAGPLSDPADLAARDCLRFGLPDYRARWHFRRAGAADQTVGVTGRLVFTSALPLRRAALLGLGPALLADWLVDQDLAAGTLVDLLPHYQATATSFDTAAWLLTPSRDWLARRVRAMARFLIQTLGDGAVTA
jgi:DNA-binding transcriptional LysR family regulator